MCICEVLDVVVCGVDVFVYVVLYVRYIRGVKFVVEMCRVVILDSRHLC